MGNKDEPGYYDVHVETMPNISIEDVVDRENRYIEQISKLQVSGQVCVWTKLKYSAVNINN